MRGAGPSRSPAEGSLHARGGAPRAPRLKALTRTADSASETSFLKGAPYRRALHDGQGLDSAPFEVNANPLGRRSHSQPVKR